MPVRLLSGFSSFLSSFNLSYHNIILLSFFASPPLPSPIFITLLLNTSNLFEDHCVVIFFPSLALQFFAMYLHLPQPKHFFSPVSLFPCSPVFSFLLFLLPPLLICLSLFFYSYFLNSSPLFLNSLFFSLLLFSSLSFFFFLSLTLTTIHIQPYCSFMPLFNILGLMF